MSKPKTVALNVSAYRTIAVPVATAKQLDAKAKANAGSDDFFGFLSPSGPVTNASDAAQLTDAVNNGLARLSGPANAAPITVATAPALDLKPIALAGLAILAAVFLWRK